jgi:hypothetical protein
MARGSNVETMIEDHGGLHIPELGRDGPRQKSLQH